MQAWLLGPLPAGINDENNKEETTMAKFNYVITDEVGLHARPAGLLVKKAKGLGAR